MGDPNIVRLSTINCRILIRRTPNKVPLFFGNTHIGPKTPKRLNPRLDCPSVCAETRKQ